MLVFSVRRGRALCEELARRLPEQYAELGEPRPGFFDSPRRSRYFRFVLQRGYEELTDPYLVERFELQRRSEVRQLIFLLVGFATLGAAAVWYEFVCRP